MPDDGPVAVFETATGAIAWTEDDGPMMDDNNPFVETAPGLVVTESRSGELYARDVGSGELRWTVPDVSGLVVPAGEVIHVVDRGNDGVRTFDTAGNELWSIDLDGDPLWIDIDGDRLAIADQSTIRIYTNR